MLFWVAKGKTIRDAGAIQGLSPHTVNKPLEHGVERLGAETRAAATAHCPAPSTGQVGLAPD